MIKNFILEYILVPVVHAQSTDGVSSLIGRINENVINPLITVLFAVAFVQFVLGLFKFFSSKENADDLETAKRHMGWGVVGMAIMVSVFGIMSFMTNTLGVGDVGKSVSQDGGGDVSGLFKSE